mgnify:CR=1 FL=1
MPIIQKDRMETSMQIHATAKVDLFGLAKPT